MILNIALGNLLAYFLFFLSLVVIAAVVGFIGSIFDL